MSRGHKGRVSRGLAQIAIAGLTIALMTAWASGAAARSGIDEPADAIGQPLDSPVPKAIQSLPLTASDGRQLDLASLRGKVVVISDMMTLCQETCPIDTATVAALARAVQSAGLGGRVEFLSITIDPARDDERHLNAHRWLFDPPPADWLTGTGTSAHLAALWHYLGVYVQRVPDRGSAPRDWPSGHRLTYDLNHSDEGFFFDPESR